MDEHGNQVRFANLSLTRTHVHVASSICVCVWEYTHTHTYTVGHCGDSLFLLTLNSDAARFLSPLLGEDCLPAVSVIVGGWRCAERRGRSTLMSPLSSLLVCLLLYNTHYAPFVSSQLVAAASCWVLFIVVILKEASLAQEWNVLS